MQEIQPFFLPQLFCSLFLPFFLPRTNVPLSTDLVARQKGRSTYVVICTLLYTRRYNRFNEFRAVLVEILCRKSKQIVDIMADYTSEVTR